MSMNVRKVRLVREDVVIQTDLLMKSDAMGAAELVIRRQRGGRIETAVIFHVVSLIPALEADSLVRTRLPECPAHNPFSVLGMYTLSGKYICQIRCCKVMFLVAGL